MKWPATVDAAEQSPRPSGAMPKRRMAWCRSLTASVLALLIGVGIGWSVSESLDRHVPGQSSPEVGFARDMFVHHEQAVQMSFLVREATDDWEVDVMALEIAQNQAMQQGRMLEWLESEGVGPTVDDYEPMAWMSGPVAAGTSAGHGGHGAAGAPAEGSDVGSRVDPAKPLMGMATDAELAELAESSGRDAEVLFLRLMYRHHQGGLEMARALLERSDEPRLTQLAQAIVTGQGREMRVIEDLLADRQAAL